MSQSPAHYITIYHGISEQCLEAIKLSDFSLEQFKLHFDVLEDDDPEMLDRYSITPLDTEFLAKYIPEDFEFNFQEFAYFLEALRQ